MDNKIYILFNMANIFNYLREVGNVWGLQEIILLDDYVTYLWSKDLKSYICSFIYKILNIFVFLM